MKNKPNVKEPNYQSEISVGAIRDDNSREISESPEKFNWVAMELDGYLARRTYTNLPKNEKVHDDTLWVTKAGLHPNGTLITYNY